MSITYVQNDEQHPYCEECAQTVFAVVKVSEQFVCAECLQSALDELELATQSALLGEQP